MVEANTAQNINQPLENFKVLLTERFRSVTGIVIPKFITQKDQVWPRITEINYNNPIVGVSEYDDQPERDQQLAQIFEKLTGNQNNQSQAVCQMLEMLKQFTRILRGETIDKILAGVGDWHTFIQNLDRLHEINLQTLEKGMDERVRALGLIDQRLADLYLRCRFVSHVISRSFQFIFKDGSRSQDEQYMLVPDPLFWRDQIIQDGTEISTVQMMVKEPQGDLYGLRFLEKNGTPLLTCGRMVKDPNCLTTPFYLIKEFNLRENQRIVGFKSVSDLTQLALHQDLQFIMMTPMTKTVLLKLLANKSQVSYSGRGLGKLPHGVFREVIRFVRY